MAIVYSVSFYGGYSFMKTALTLLSIGFAKNYAIPSFWREKFAADMSVSPGGEGRRGEGIMAILLSNLVSPAPRPLFPSTLQCR